MPLRRSIMLLATLPIFALPAAGEDLVVDSGTVTLGPGEVYDSLTVLSNATVIIDGATVMGRTEIEGAGEVILNQGLLMGRVSDIDCIVPFGESCGGRLTVNGGEIADRVSGISRAYINDGRVGWVGANRIEMQGGEAEYLGTSDGGYITITGGIVHDRVDAEPFEARRAHVTNATVNWLRGGVAGEGAVILHSAYEVDLLEGAVLYGGGSRVSVKGGHVFGNLSSSEIENGIVEGNARSSSVSPRGWVKGTLIAEDIFFSDEARLDGGRVERIEIERFGDLRYTGGRELSARTESNGAYDVTVEVPYAARFRIYGYRVEVDGQPVEFQGHSPVWFSLSEGQPPVDHEVNLINSRGLRSRLHVRLLEAGGGDSSAMQVFGEPLEAGCAPSDLAAPHGIFDLNDIALFAALFAAQDPAAEFDGDPDIRDAADIDAFLAGFAAGCD